MDPKTMGGTTETSGECDKTETLGKRFLSMFSSGGTLKKRTPGDSRRTCFVPLFSPYVASATFSFSLSIVDCFLFQILLKGTKWDVRHLH
jgi:hypothetical protein